MRGYTWHFQINYFFGVSEVLICLKKLIIVYIMKLKELQLSTRTSLRYINNCRPIYKIFYRKILSAVNLWCECIIFMSIINIKEIKCIFYETKNPFGFFCDGQLQNPTLRGVRHALGRLFQIHWSQYFFLVISVKFHNTSSVSARTANLILVGVKDSKFFNQHLSWI